MRGVTRRSEASGDVGLVDWPEPPVTPGHVILKVAAAGVCGTDLHIFKNEYKVTPPVIMGHEVCGTVVETGSGVDSSLMGKRFVAETFYSTCGVCRHCRNGRPNLCVERRSIGSHVNGAMTSLVEVPVGNLHAAPKDLSDAEASLAEPVACVTNSLFGTHGYVEPGLRTLVVGPGAIGIIAAQVAVIQGAEVTLRGSERDQARLKLATSLGFETSTVGDKLPEDSFDTVIECSGSPMGYADALRFTSRAGHLVQMGLSGKTSDLPTDLICYKELSITSGFASTPRSWRRAMALLNGGKLRLEPLITDFIPLDHWKIAFDRSFTADGVKFVLHP